LRAFKEMIFELAAFVLDFPVLAIIFINFPFELVDGLLQSGTNLLVLTDLDLIILIMVHFAMQFQLLFLQLRYFSIPLLEQIIKFL
jgi:hypothetical protein